ncbi:MAG: hypothetical protein V4610_08395 [Pseudomonadota bacterium]|jgi:hypothetical protein|uniref:Outer membrane assembly lipoprotein YfiO n=1 Tax=hydrothermal vent metagenome TaxID=652676 RepID=A0A160TKS6_9ZZZZ
MYRIGALFVAMLLSLAWQAPASASGDFSCTQEWKLKHQSMTGCADMAILGPANDTRVNLSLLLLDKRTGKPGGDGPVPPLALFDWPTFRKVYFPQPGPSADTSYAEGEGSRCRSNDSGTAAFAAALGAARQVPETERALLIATRRALQPNCTGANADAGVADRVKSTTGKAFARYLQGANAFYGGDYDIAAARFASLHGADQPWLRETGDYMLGRVEVNRAQVNAFDEYGYPKPAAQADTRVIAAAEAALHAYLSAYPRGLYAASARGLLRRVYWLGGRDDRLVAEYAALFAQGGVDGGALADEIDNKLLPRLKIADTTDPILLALLDLARMRDNEGNMLGSSDAPPITLAELEAQRDRFAASPALFTYLLAAHAYFVQGKPEAVLKLIPDAARQADFSYLQFSGQMLRGAALDAVKDRNARGFWIEMLAGAKRPFQRPAIELALALHDERAGALDGLFASGSPLRAPDLREILLTNVAGPVLLRRQARDAQAPKHERDVALFTLLYKDLTRGAYRDFLADQAMIPPGAPTDGNLYGEQPPIGIFTQAKGVGDYDCPALKEMVRQLAGDPLNARARLCLGDFMRVTGFDGYPLDSKPPADQLGGTPSLFPGSPFSRLEIYKAIIADPKAPAPDKAYALFRAINCYATSGNNSCGGTEVVIAQRKAWFQRLKKEYPTSRWAQELRYYW